MDDRDKTIAMLAREVMNLKEKLQEITTSSSESSWSSTST